MMAAAPVVHVANAYVFVPIRVGCIEIGGTMHQHAVVDGMRAVRWHVPPAQGFPKDEILGLQLMVRPEGEPASRMLWFGEYNQADATLPWRLLSDDDLADVASWILRALAEGIVPDMADETAQWQPSAEPELREWVEHIAICIRGNLKMMYFDIERVAQVIRDANPGDVLVDRFARLLLEAV